MAGKVPTVGEQDAMAAELGATSLFYLPVDAVARCIGLPEDRLCRACITGQYPTRAGEQLYQLALRNYAVGDNPGRTYESTCDPELCTAPGAVRT
jgi:amidophosphoribosyltransferase